MSLSCPSCGKKVLNRNYPRCEFCAAALPTSMLRTQAERDAIEAESRRRQAINEEKSRKRAEEYQKARETSAG